MRNLKECIKREKEMREDIAQYVNSGSYDWSNEDIDTGKLFNKEVDNFVEENIKLEIPNFMQIPKDKSKLIVDKKKESIRNKLERSVRVEIEQLKERTIAKVNMDDYKSWSIDNIVRTVSEESLMTSQLDIKKVASSLIDYALRLHRANIFSMSGRLTVDDKKGGRYGWIRYIKNSGKYINKISRDKQGSKSAHLTQEEFDIAVFSGVVCKQFSMAIMEKYSKDVLGWNGVPSEKENVYKKVDKEERRKLQAFLGWDNEGYDGRMSKEANKIRKAFIQIGEDLYGALTDNNIEENREVIEKALEFEQFCEDKDDWVLRMGNGQFAQNIDGHIKDLVLAKALKKKKFKLDMDL